MSYRESTLDPHPVFSGNVKQYEEDGRLTGRAARIAEIYGSPETYRDAFFHAKFYKTESGELEVRPGWSFAKFIQMRCEPVSPLAAA